VERQRVFNGEEDELYTEFAIIAQGVSEISGDVKKLLDELIFP